MLYKKNVSESLDKELFANPTSEYRGAPFWAWNCRLNKEALLRQIEYLKEMGFGGFHMHSRTGMATEYLSDEFMDLIDACAEKAEKEEMLAWLYDEDRWPSGAAGGLVTKNPRFRARMLLFTVKPREDAESFEEAVKNGGTAWLACYDVLLDADGNLESYKRIGTEDKAIGTKWYAYMTTQEPDGWFNGQAYVDTLDKKSIQEFIRITYGRYKQTEGSRFGKTIPAIFTDEPQFGCKETFKFPHDKNDVNLPWTPEFEKRYFTQYNENILDYIPELFWNLKNGAVSRHRYNYHDFVSELFAQSFAGQCGKWCEENGISLTGHLMCESPLENQTEFIGDAMRSYPCFQIPGVDVLCKNFEFETVKQAQSASRQCGREGVMSELYGVSNWDFDFREHKIHGDWQAAMGITVRVPHLSWVSMEGMAKHDYPASINYQSPWYKEYSYVENHFARVNTAMTRGKSIVKVGVIHPIESFWLHWGAEFAEAGIRKQMNERFTALTKWLIEGCIDFDFICESTLPKQCDNGIAPFKVGEMKYDVVVVPACETLRSTTLEHLRQFKESGGKLIFLGGAPKFTDAEASSEGAEMWNESDKADFEQTAVLEALEEFRVIDIHNDSGTRTDNLTYQLRRDNNCLWLFAAHCKEPENKDISGDMPQNIIIKIKGEYSPVLWNTLDGTQSEILYHTENGCTVIQMTIYDHDSLLIQLNVAKASKQSEEKKEVRELIFEKPIIGRCDYVRSEPNVAFLDRAEYSIDGEEFNETEEVLRINGICLKKIYDVEVSGSHGDANRCQPWAVPEEEVRHHLKLRFTVNSEIDADNIMLGAELAEKLIIKWNGEDVKNNICGYYVDESIKTVALPPLKKGKNTLEVTMPYTQRSCVEAYYILGEFDVRVNGTEILITKKSDKVGFSDISSQGMAFYGGNITYCADVDTPSGDMQIHVPVYRGALIRVKVDGKDCGVIAYAPYSTKLRNIENGKHRIEITLYGNRYNTFGPLHDVSATRYVGPMAWSTQNDSWTYSYRFKETGILAESVVRVYKKS